MKVEFQFDLKVTPEDQSEVDPAKRLEAYLKMLLLPQEVAMRTVLERKLSGEEWKGLRDGVRES